MSQEEILNYLAGFFEGDGCVTVTHKHTKYPMLCLRVGQCRSKEPLYLFKKQFGGNIYEDIHRSPITTAKESHVWAITGNQAIKTLDILLPYCRFRNEEYKEKLNYYLKNRVGAKNRGRPVKNTI